MMMKMMMVMAVMVVMTMMMKMMMMMVMVMIMMMKMIIMVMMMIMKMMMTMMMKMMMMKMMMMVMMVVVMMRKKQEKHNSIGKILTVTAVNLHSQTNLIVPVFWFQSDVASGESFWCFTVLHRVHVEVCSYYLQNDNKKNTIFVLSLP